MNPGTHYVCGDTQVWQAVGDGRDILVATTATEYDSENIAFALNYALARVRPR